MWPSSSLQQLLEQLHRHQVLVLAADLAGARVEVAGVELALEVALQHLLDVLADHQGRDHLQIGKTFEEDDARHQLVGMMHLLDRFLALLLGELGEAPVLEHAVVQPVLVDGAELVLEGLVEDVDDVFLALHAALRCVAPTTGSGCRDRREAPADRKTAGERFPFLRHLRRPHQRGLWTQERCDKGYQTGARAGLPAPATGVRRRRRTMGACSISFCAGVSLAHLRRRPCAQAQA